MNHNFPVLWACLISIFMTSNSKLLDSICWTFSSDSLQFSLFWSVKYWTPCTIFSVVLLGEHSFHFPLRVHHVFCLLVFFFLMTSFPSLCIPGLSSLCTSLVADPLNQRKHSLWPLNHSNNYRSRKILFVSFLFFFIFKLIL